MSPTTNEVKASHGSTGALLSLAVADVSGRREEDRGAHPLPGAGAHRRNAGRQGHGWVHVPAPLGVLATQPINKQPNHLFFHTENDAWHQSWVWDHSGCGVEQGTSAYSVSVIHFPLGSFLVLFQFPANSSQFKKDWMILHGRALTVALYTFVEYDLWLAFQVLPVRDLASMETERRCL